MTKENAARAATHEAVRHALELYADCYDTVTRIAQREGREPVVSPVSVAFDIRKNMVNAVIKALSRLRAPVAIPAGFALVPIVPTPEMLDAADERVGAWQHEESRAAYSAMITAAPATGAPVAGEAQPSDADISGTIRALESESRKARAADGETGVRVTDVMIARAVLARYGHFPDGLMVDMTPPATARDRWMYEQGRLAERDPRSHAAPQASADTPADRQQRAGGDGVLRFALEAIEAELDPQWECTSYHPKLHAAVERLRAALSATHPEQGERDEG